MMQALIHGGVSRVVVGISHPLPHARGRSISALRSAGVCVDVLGEAPLEASGTRGVVSLPGGMPSPASGGALASFGMDVAGDISAVERSAIDACLRVNEPLLHRAALRRPLSILKYAMTLDGKIATQAGHSAWVTSPPARAMVFEQRSRSDAVIVGGNTVRRVSSNDSSHHRPPAMESPNATTPHSCRLNYPLPPLPYPDEGPS